MIDIDKYEGHTPAPWDKLSEYCPVGSIDKQLITDAPLLLAEVLRLREQQKQIHDLLAEVLPRKDGVPHLGTALWGLESELKRVTDKMAVILGMAECEEE